MKSIRLPMSAKIAGLFLLNLAALAVSFVFLLGNDWRLFATPAFRSSRLDEMAPALLRRLEQSPLRDWDKLLADASSEHGVTFYLYSARGPRLAGPGDFLPGNVHSLAVVDRPRRMSPPPRPPQFGDPRSPHVGPPDMPDFRKPPPPAWKTSADESAEKHPRYPVIIATNGYWSFTMARVNHPEISEKVALITRSDSPTAHGFYSDHLPLYVVAGLLFAGSILLWLPFVRSSTRSLRQMQQAAAKMSHGDFSTRVEARRGDELGALGRSVNHMADQIGSLVEGQRRLLGDIAHELSSPIARMQAVIGILEIGTDTPEKYIARLDGEVQHMGALVQELLSLTKANLKRVIDLQPVALAPLLRRVMERENPYGKTVILECPEDLCVMSDPELLSRAVGNVLRNAIRYAASGGPIRILCAEDEAEITIRILDRGPGVPEHAVPRLFDAFYRPDVARTRETGGSGLGLAIAKSCIEATSGTITANNRKSGGLEIAITQPSCA